MEEAQRKVMEMEQCEVEAVEKRICTILNRVTLLETNIKIPNPERFMWTQTKQNNDKHVEWMENWKDIGKEEDSAFKVGFVPLFVRG
jgi:hypothetical protein